MEDNIIAETSKVIFFLITVWSVISKATKSALAWRMWVIGVIDVAWGEGH